MSNHERTRSEHPSYGQVTFRRVQGRESTLYGSALASHESTVSLVISRSVVKHELVDRYYARDPLIEVVLSSAQFSSLLTTMNVGDGVPCTIRAYNGVPLEKPPCLTPEHERIESEFDSYGKYSKQIIDPLDQALSQVDAMLAGRTLKKKDLVQVRNSLGSVRQTVTSKLPYALSRFRSAVEKVKTAIMAETDSWLSSVIQRSGVRVIQADNIKMLAQISKSRKENTEQ